MLYVHQGRLILCLLKYTELKGLGEAQLLYSWHARDFKYVTCILFRQRNQNGKWYELMPGLFPPTLCKCQQSVLCNKERGNLEINGFGIQGNCLGLDVLFTYHCCIVPASGEAHHAPFFKSIIEGVHCCFVALGELPR